MDMLDKSNRWAKRSPLARQVTGRKPKNLITNEQILCDLEKDEADVLVTCFVETRPDCFGDNLVTAASFQ